MLHFNSFNNECLPRFTVYYFFNVPSSLLVLAFTTRHTNTNNSSNAPSTKLPLNKDITSNNELSSKNQLTYDLQSELNKKLVTHFVLLPFFTNSRKLGKIISYHIRAM